MSNLNTDDAAALNRLMAWIERQRAQGRPLLFQLAGPWGSNATYSCGVHIEGEGWDNPLHFGAGDTIRAAVQVVMEHATRPD